MEGSIEDQVGALFAQQGLTPERLGAAEYEGEVRREVARLETAGSSPSSDSANSESPTTSSTDDDGFKRFGRMTSFSEALGRPKPTPEEVERQRQMGEELATLRRAGLNCLFCEDARAYRPRPGVVVPCPECVPPEEHMERAGTPTQFTGATLAGMEPLPGKRPAILLAASWNMTSSVVIYSRNTPGDAMFGTGKTMLACAMLRRVVEARGRSVRFVDIQSFLEALKDGMDTPGKQEFLMHDALSADALVLDDIGAERPTEWALDRISYMIRERYARGRTTIITTNFTGPDEIEATFGGRVASRLSAAIWIPIGGEDLRYRERAQ